MHLPYCLVHHLESISMKNSWHYYWNQLVSSKLLHYYVHSVLFQQVLWDFRILLWSHISHFLVILWDVLHSYASPVRRRGGWEGYQNHWFDPYLFLYFDDNLCYVLSHYLNLSSCLSLKYQMKSFCFHCLNAFISKCDVQFVLCQIMWCNNHWHSFILSGLDQFAIWQLRYCFCHVHSFLPLTLE